jgi:membrane protein insertase Oxa1/YidC/SpoIIIJ
MLLYVVIQNPLSYIAKYDMDAVSSTVQNEELSEQDQINEAIEKIYNHINPPEEGAEAVDFKSIQQITLISDINKYVKNNENGAAEIEGMGLQLDSIPNFSLFGVNLAETPSIKNISILVLIPILAAVSSWFSMWFTRKFNGNPTMGAQDAQAQASMKIMDLMMPLMTLFIAFNFSGMLGIYWIFQSLLGVGQTLIIAKAMPLPKYTEEELKEMRRAQKAAEKAQKAVLKSQPKYKSLHYIDEDDYDELPEMTKQSAEKKPKSSMDMPEIKD